MFDSADALECFFSVPSKCCAVWLYRVLMANESADTSVGLKGNLFVSTRGSEEDIFDKLVPFVVIIKEL